jgi:tol-pal system-associated acyl-CoA thioesterase
VSPDEPGVHVHHVQIYYEDTDLSGAVYHANYLKYFERAREHMLGPEELVRLYYQEDTGFVVYRAGLTYRKSAGLGDTLEIRTRGERTSPWRALFHHEVWREGEDQPLVTGEIEMVCVDGENKLVPLPQMEGF